MCSDKCQLSDQLVTADKFNVTFSWKCLPNTHILHLIIQNLCYMVIFGNMQRLLVAHKSSELTLSSCSQCMCMCMCFVHFLEYLLQFAHLKPFEKWNKFVHSFEHFVFEFSKQKRICFFHRTCSWELKLKNSFNYAIWWCWPLHALQMCTFFIRNSLRVLLVACSFGSSEWSGW